MFRTFLKSKLHRVTITEAELHYQGSITIDRDLMDAADLLAYEKVQIVNVNNGERLETYVIEGERGSGVICLNGPAARRGQAGDVIMIMSYVVLSESEFENYEPRTVFVDENNKITQIKAETVSTC
jgi:aspartate 1-decarboxylase